MIHTMNSKNLIKELLRDGWVLNRVNGSHHIYKHPKKSGHISVPHPKRDLGAGLIRQIRKAAGLCKETP